MTSRYNLTTTPVVELKIGPTLFILCSNDRPYLVRQESSGAWWIYIWNKGPKQFVSYRELNQQELWEAEKIRLPDAEAQLYLDQHIKHMPPGAVYSKPKDSEDG